MKPARMFPLHVAVEKFATKADLKSLEPPLVLHPEHSAEPDMTTEEAAKRLSLNLPALANEIFRPVRNRQKLFERLCHRVERGLLISYGIRTKPTVGETPELIPAYLFRHPEWDDARDAIENAGYRFELVEVGRPLRGVKQTPSQTPPKTMGRPSKQKEIEEIVIEILSDPSAPVNRKALCDRVRATARERGLEVSRGGYSDTTISRIIVRAEARSPKPKLS